MEKNVQKSTAKQSSGGMKKIIITLILVIAGIGAILIYREGQRFETTDNAQIDGNIIPVRTKITGYVESLRFRDNQHVNKGDTLVVFETVDLITQVVQAQARLDNALAGVDISKTGKQSANLNTTAADFSASAGQESITAAKARLDQAQSDFTRTKALYDNGAATVQAFDLARSSLDVARAQYQGTQKQFQALSAQKQNAGSQIMLQSIQLLASQSRVAEVTAQLASARYLLSNAYIIAPCSGIVSKKSVEPGQMILAGSALAMLIDDQNIWITANFKETQLDRIQSGQTISAELDAYKDVTITGKVESVAGAAGSKFSLLPADNASGNFIKVTQRVPVRIALSSVINPHKKMIFPGLSATVKIRVR